MVRYRNLFMIFGLVVLAHPAPAQGGPPPPPTNILYGFITSHKTLTYASPGPVYYVVGDVVVNAGVTLTIEPGVSIVFEANSDTLQGGNWSYLSELEVKGTLIADATAGDSIRFKSSSPGAIGWGFIDLATGASGTFRRVVVQDALTAINGGNGSSLTVENCRFTGNNTGIGGGSSPAVIHDCTFVNHNGWCVIGSFNAQLERLTATDAANGINIAGGAVRECSIAGKSNGTGTGLVLWSGVSTAPADSTDPHITSVSGFQYGVVLNSNAVATNLLVHHNIVGISHTGGFGQQIVYCTVANSSGRGIELAGSARVYMTVVTNSGLEGILTTQGGPGYVNYVDSWNSGGANFGGVSVGAQTASFNPLYVNSAGLNYHLSSGSPFKIFGPWGAEIGAYGPGPGTPVKTQAATWGRIKAAWR